MALPTLTQESTPDLRYSQSLLPPNSIPACPIPCRDSWLRLRPNPQSSLTGALASKDRRKWPTSQLAFLWDEVSLLAAQGPMGGQGSITHEGAESTLREELFFHLQDLAGLGVRGLDPEVRFHSMPPNQLHRLTVTVPYLWVWLFLALSLAGWTGQEGYLFLST